jgi:acyl-ACP thioesterase
MELSCRRDYRVASHTVGPQGFLRPSALLGFLEDIAGEHAATWHLSIGNLRARGLMWVLTRYHLRLLRPPRYGEAIAVTTWPSARLGRVALRDFEVTDAAGEAVALATTAWAALDVKTRRPRAMDDVVPPEFVLARRALADDFPPLPGVEEPAREVELPVMLRDLDMNRHVNHAVYLEWAFEAIPPELLEHGLPEDIEIAYLAEAGPGDRISTAASPLPPRDRGPAYAHRISLDGGGRELARLRTSWPR